MDEMVRRLERSEARRRSPARTGDDALRRRSVELVAPLPRRAAPSPRPCGGCRTMSTRWASCTPGRRHDPGQRAPARRPGLGRRLRARPRAGPPARARPRQARSGPGCAATRAPSGRWATWRGCRPRPGSGLVGTDGDDVRREPTRTHDERHPRRIDARRRRRSSAIVGLRVPRPRLVGLVSPGRSRRSGVGLAPAAAPSRSRRIAFSSSAIGSPSSSRATNAAGSSRSSADGIRSGCAHSASRPSIPRCSPSSRHSSAALRSCRGRSSSPTIVANVCSAGPARRAPPAQRLAQRRRPGQPVADRVRDHRVHPALDQREQRLQPGQRRLLRRAWSAARTSPSCMASSIAPGFDGSMPRASSSIRERVDR